MSSFKFGQMQVASKDFRRRKHITTIDINKAALSDKVPCNNGKDCQDIAGYKVEKGNTYTTVYQDAQKHI